ncbi:MAG: hypothetical protein E6G39_08465 [Actinobacteria bacterium]|nr:MAG: hypothetical protein E6G39_08465 [Actinomycetota bacterium]
MPFGARFSRHGRKAGSFHHHHFLIVAGDGDVRDEVQQVGLALARGVDGLQSDAGLIVAT